MFCILISPLSHEELVKISPGLQVFPHPVFLLCYFLGRAEDFWFDRTKSWEDRVLLRKYLPGPVPWNVGLMFSPGFRFSSNECVWPILSWCLGGVRLRGLVSVSYIWTCGRRSTVCWRGWVFSCFWHLYCLAVDGWIYFRVLHSIPWVSLPVFMPIPCCFCDMALRCVLKSGIVTPLVWLFLLRIALSIWDLFNVHLNFRAVFFSFHEESHGGFREGDCTGSGDSFG